MSKNARATAARCAVAVAATWAAGLAHAGWVPSLVQAATGQTFVQVVNDRGEAGGYVRTVATVAGRGGPRQVVTDHAFFFDGVGVTNDAALWARTGVQAKDINRSGQVLFGNFVSDHGVQSTVAGSATALNDAGQLAATVQVGLFADGVFHTALGRLDGSFQDLGALGGKVSQSQALNNRGQVVGFSQYPGSGTDIHAVLYDGQALIDLGQLLDPAAASFATGINDDGTVIGTVNTALGGRGFVYRNGAMALLALQGSTGQGTTTAAAVNAAGQVVATSCVLGALCEVLLDNQGQVSVLGRMAGFSTSAVGLNDRGQVLVQTEGTGDQDFGLWDQGTLLNLDDLVASLGFTDVTSATLASGYLAGYGTLANGQTQSFLLRDTGNSVPEPASALLVTAALAALVVPQRRKR